jgi:uncharacterized membrane protein
MKHKFITIMSALLITITPMAGLTGTALAACGHGSSSKDQVLTGLGEAGGNCSEKPVVQTIAAAVQILSFIVGIVAIISIILAGFKYITSGGDSNRVGNAKQTLIYAIVGIIVAALAQVLVHFVLYQIHNAQDPPKKKTSGLDSSRVM